MVQIHLNIMDSQCLLHSLVLVEFYLQQCSARRQVNVDVSVALTALENKPACATDSIRTGGISSLLSMQAIDFGATY